MRFKNTTIRYKNATVTIYVGTFLVTEKPRLLEKQKKMTTTTTATKETKRKKITEKKKAIITKLKT